jgi:hypothetical protein
MVGEFAKKAKISPSVDQTERVAFSLPPPRPLKATASWRGGARRLPRSDARRAGAHRLERRLAATFSNTQSRAKRPDWMSARMRFISARVSPVTIRGPATYSPYSAVFEIAVFMRANPLWQAVDNQFHFVQAFETGNFRRIARLDRRVVTRASQLHQTAAEHHLLAEQIGSHSSRKVVSMMSARPLPIPLA